jgi:hypothetical protein
MSASAAADLRSQFVANGSRMAVKDTTFTTNVVVTNKGDAVAPNARVNVNIWGAANIFSSTTSPNPPFAPAVAFASGCVSVTGGTCSLGNVAPGESRIIPVTVTKLTHFGSFTLSSYAYHDNGYNDQGYRSWTVQVTNGKKSLLQVDADAPATAAGRTDVVVRGEIANGGPDTIDSGRLIISTTRLDNTGDYFQSWNSSTKPEVASIRSLTLSNGTVCSPFVQPATNKPDANKFVCVVDGLAPNARLTFELLVNYPTSKTDFTVTVDGTFVSTNYLAPGSNAGFMKVIELSPEKTVDLEMSVQSQALIGMDRIAPVTLQVRNLGSARAENVSIGGDARGGVGGVFDTGTFPSTCTGIVKPIFARCSLGTIEPGATATFTINVRATAMKGLFAVTFGASHNSTPFIFDTNPDNNAATATFTVVPAGAVPFMGVKETNPAPQVMTQFLRTGTKTTFTCPSSCRTTVSLQVKRSVAERLGLVRKAGVRARVLPYIVIGKAVKARTGSGKLVVLTRVNRAYAAKLAKLRVPLTLNRVSTVVATDPSIRGASYTRTKPLVVRPARRR